MSLFGAMNTAISGLTAQSAAFSNISDNVANSQTVGFKRVDTAFIDYLTTSTAATNDSGAVVAQPEYMNNVQGTVAQTDNPLGLAIAGQGFFPVSHPAGSLGGQTSFSPTPYYSRTGDFQLNKSGYVVNSAGEYLNGWSVNSTTGVVNRNAVTPIQVSQTVFNPVATSKLTLSANLPATPASGTAVSSQINVYDGLGTAHTVTLNWTQNAANDWTVSVNVPDDITAAARGTADVQFGVTSGNRWRTVPWATWAWPQGASPRRRMRPTRRPLSRSPPISGRARRPSRSISAISVSRPASRNTPEPATRCAV